MPRYRTEQILDLKVVKAFLRLDLGLGKAVPDQASTPDPRIEKLSRRVRNLSRLNANLERKVSERTRELQELRSKLDTAKVGVTSSEVSPESPLLPPKNARPCGPTQKDDATYLRTADTDATRLCEKLGVAPGKALLDVGCGPGRVAIGLTRKLGDELTYHGLDVNARWLNWAHENLTPRHPTYTFAHLDIRSDRYNPGGNSLPEGFAFPVPDGSFDFICLFSVFTHMLTEDVTAYLRDFHRVLKPGGRMLVTAFLEDDVPDVEENPQGFLGQNWSGPLHCVRYKREFFYQMLKDAGFELDQEDPSENFQRHLYVSRSETI